MMIVFTNTCAHTYLPRVQLHHGVLPLLSEVIHVQSTHLLQQQCWLLQTPQMPLFCCMSLGTLRYFLAYSKHPTIR